MLRGKIIISLLAAVAAASALPALAQGQQYVSPYVRQNGTFVQGHMQTMPNSTRADNWSTRGNVNPYTGQAGTRDPNPAPTANPWGGLNQQPRGYYGR